MKRKTISLLLCLLLLGCLLVPASASSDLPMVVDGAGLLTESELASLEEKAQSLRDAYEMDVVILTVETLNGMTAQTLADSFYDNNGYGYDETGSGVLFLLTMAEREWYISTCGDAIYALTDYGIESIGEEMLPDLSGGRYYEAFDTFLALLPGYFDAFRGGSPVDGYAGNSGGYAPGTREDVVYYPRGKTVNYGARFLIALIIGIAAAGVTILIMRSSMNTKRQQHSAVDYLKPGSFNLYRHQDLFLYSHVSKTRRPQNNDNGHHGGGSSVHTGSGGRSHGGGGGKF